MSEALWRSVQRANNLSWEWRLGVSTRGRLDARKRLADAVHYATIDYSDIHKIIRRLSLQPTDTFVDVGCGKGRVLCCAARYSCGEVVGIDYSEEFCTEARANAEMLRGRRTPIIVENGLAQEFDYSNATVLYFFCPFGPTTLDAVLHKIQADRAGDQVRMAFVNLSQEHDEVFARHQWLEPYHSWHTARWVKFWRQKATGYAGRQRR